MDFRQLETFIALANELHFAQTAKRCFMTPSALTRSIQRLEEEMGYDLLIRNNRRVELTVAGKVFAQFAEDVLLQWSKTQALMQVQEATLLGKLKVYGSVTATYSVLSQLLTEFRKVYPKVELQLHTGDYADAIYRVQSGIEDIGIAALPDDLSSALLFKTLTFSPLRFIMPAHSVAIAEQLADIRAEKHDVVDVSKLPIIVSEQGLARERFNQWLAARQLTPNIYAEVSGHEAIVSMVALGFGIGLVPEIVIQHSALADKIRVIDDAPELQAFQIGLCVLKSKLEHPVVRAFWDVADPSIFKGVL